MPLHALLYDGDGDDAGDGAGVGVGEDDKANGVDRVKDTRRKNGRWVAWLGGSERERERE